jgi:hypothetical protein
VKCVHCKNDAKYKDRRDGYCPSCKRRFAFEPQRGDPMTDGSFAAAIERVSSGGRVRFTAEHLHYEIRRRYRRTLRGHVLGGIAAFFFPTLLFSFVAGFIGPLAVVLVITLGTLGLMQWLMYSKGVQERRRFPREKFDLLLRRYTDAHGVPKTMIERKEPVRRRVAPAAQSEEMLAYSFDRAVICDRAETVDFLIANQFHFENNCAVLGIHGYPEHAFETVRAMLRNNPRLAVIALHDATVEGCKLAHRLRNDSAWFKGGVPVVDIGLRPAHRDAFRGQEDSNDPRLRVEPGAGISQVEAAWLAHSSLALAVVLPEQIIKRLFRAITLVEDKQDDDSGSGGGSSSSDGDMSTEADASDGGGDSFG